MISTPYDHIAAEFRAARAALPDHRWIHGLMETINEMCSAPDGGRDQGKGATIAWRQP